MAERTSKHRTIAVDVDEEARLSRPQFTLPWYLTASLGALSVVAAGWLLAAGPSALGWLTSPNVQLSDAMGLASRILLLAHGSSVQLGGQLVSLVPLGFTLALLFLGVPVATLAARGAVRAYPEITGEQVVLRIAGLFGGTYTAAVFLVGMATPGASAGRALVGAVLVGGSSSYWGATRAVAYDPRRSWPTWVRAVPRALSAAVLTCIGAGAALLATTLVLHRDRLVSIADGLGGGVTAGLLLTVIQLAWLPNLIVWATAWALGGGLTLGDGSLVSMGITDVGFLPAIPVFGAIPPEGPVSHLAWWWLLGGVVAGVVVGLIVTLARPAHRFDETTLVGGLSGVAAGLILVLLGWFASGGLGTQRLAYMGVRLGDLAITAPSLMGLAGLITGLTVGLLRREWPERVPATSSQETAEEDEETLRR